TNVLRIDPDHAADRVRADVPRATAAPPIHHPEDGAGCGAAAAIAVAETHPRFAPIVELDDEMSVFRTAVEQVTAALPDHLAGVCLGQPKCRHGGDGILVQVGA